MCIAEMIGHFEDKGIGISLGYTGKLRVDSKEPLNDEQRQYLSKHKPEIIKHLIESGLEAAEERAAIMEYDGGLSRKEAETYAVKAHLRSFFFTTTDGEGTYLGRAETIEEARKALEHRFGKKLVNLTSLS